MCRARLEPLTASERLQVLEHFLGACPAGLQAAVVAATQGMEPSQLRSWALGKTWPAAALQLAVDVAVPEDDW